MRTVFVAGAAAAYCRCGVDRAITLLNRPSDLAAGLVGK
jgi:hypothetical protein